jgi:hypothetical protein
MAIILTPFSVGELCDGCSWAVDNVDVLAEQIARVAVGQAEHVADILAQAGLAEAATTAEAIEDAVELLTVAGGAPYHRDGWMFQVMSWIAAHRHTPGGLISVPHMILAHKGFDGIQIDLDSDTGAVTAVVVFEDKATENPRAKIREDVWPDFRNLEAGKKQNVLAAQVTTLLKAASHPDPNTAVQKVIWADARRYRVSITIENGHATEEGRAQLFADYDEVAPGDRWRRRGETFLVPNLRDWMATLAELAVSKARVLEVMPHV